MNSRSKGKVQKAKVQVKSFQVQVLAYWRKHGRHNLPWRKTTDPYAILVSEIMLQQTQVERVTPYFKRWMKKFPIAEKLAKASLVDVLKEWSGLGYNRRAKMLRECAREILEKHGGKVPRDFAALTSLPGVGPYTAGAIRAFAFNEKEVFIETNIRAALIHHFFPKSKKVSDEKLVPILHECLARVKSSREWYSALMDYGTHIKATHSNPSRHSTRHVRQSKFEGSLRQARGAILKAIIHRETLRAVRTKYEQRFEEAYQSLVRDGLIVESQKSNQQ